jgi:hypothetical protein
VELFKACLIAVVVVAMGIASFYLAYAFVVLALLAVVVLIGLVVLSKPEKDGLKWHDKP